MDEETAQLMPLLMAAFNVIRVPDNPLGSKDKARLCGSLGEANLHEVSASKVQPANEINGEQG